MRPLYFYIKSSGLTFSSNSVISLNFSSTSLLNISSCFDINGLSLSWCLDYCPKENYPTNNCPPPPREFLLPKITALKDNCPSRQLPPRKIAPWLIAPWKKYPKLPHQKITLKMTASWQHPPGNCSWVKLSFGWFVKYIIPLRKTIPRNVVPRIIYIRFIFTQEWEIVVL